jgi:hypothetical protein
VLVQADPAAVRIVMWLAVVLIKRPRRARHRTTQRLLLTAELVVCRHSAIQVAAVVVAALPKLVVRVLATEVRAQAVELAEKVAKELPTQCELILQLCTALAVVAKEDG